MPFLKYSSIGKWGGQLKTTKQEIRNFMILKLKGTRNLFSLLK